MELASSVKDNVTMKLSEILANGYTPTSNYYNKAKRITEAVETLFGSKVLNDAYEIHGLTFLNIAENLLEWQTAQQETLPATLHLSVK